MKRIIGIAGLFFMGAAVFSQSRNDVSVYVAPTTGGSATDCAFFDENFKMEIEGANYMIVDNERQADYTIRCSISADEDWADPMAMVNVLLLVLIDNSDGHEVVQFSWDYHEIEEMYEWNLHLIYQAMANVPMTKIVAVPDTNHWRNKWIYITVYGMANLQLGFFDKNLINEDQSNRSPYTFYLSPAVNLALEFQFLNFMSIEAGFAGAQQDFGGQNLSGMRFVLPIMLKFPIKPARHFMLEPYLGIQFNMPPSGGYIAAPLFSWVGGFQYGVRAGERSALLIELRVAGELPFPNDSFHTRVMTSVVKGRTADWINLDLFDIYFGIGFKIGFYNRNREDT